MNASARSRRSAIEGPRRVRRRIAILAPLLALPMAGLGLLLARPHLDVMWENHPSHFWLVLGIALINVGLGVATSEAARQREDPRIFLVSLALLISAGFLALHALATPGVLLAGPNAGFVVATPLGLVLASGFAALSAAPITAGSACSSSGISEWSGL